MISRQNHINRIASSLVQLASLVDLHNKLDLFDINRHAEPFYRELLNRVYGWNLRSLNTSTNRNQPAIDLGDTSASISVQVTASDRRDKVQETLDKFHSHELYTEYKNLKIVVITNKSEFKKEFVTAKINFDKEHDILDISDLLWEISQLADVGRIAEIDEFLKRELASNLKSIKSDARTANPSIVKEQKDPTASLLQHISQKDTIASYLISEGTEDAHQEISILFNEIAKKVAELSKQARSLDVEVGGNNYHLVARRKGLGACTIEIQWQQTYRNKFDDAQLMVTLWKGLRRIPGRSEIIFESPISGAAQQMSFQVWRLKCSKPKIWNWEGGTKGSSYSSMELANLLYSGFTELIKAHHAD